jgi:hypothetical protein
MRSSLWPPRRSMARWSVPLAALSCAAHGAKRALELHVPAILRMILMRLRVVRILVPEGTLMCRTHTTQHELSAIAPNFVGGRKTLEARAVWVGLIRKRRFLS